VQLLSPLQVKCFSPHNLRNAGEQAILLDVVGRQGLRDREDARDVIWRAPGVNRTWLW